MIEITALVRNWTRWKNCEYNNQFDHNIGLGNLKQVSIVMFCALWIQDTASYTFLVYDYFNCSFVHCTDL